MKKTALLAAAAAMFAATPAFAGGHVGVGYTNTDSGNSDADSWQVEGAYGGASGALGYQLDAGIGNSDAGVSDVDHHTIAGHLFWHTDNWNLGGAIATSSFEDNTFSADELVYGVEGTFNVAPNAVLRGSYMVGESEFLTIDVDTWNADLGLDYYFSDNFRVGGAIGSGNLDFGGGADFDTSTYGIDAEWQFASLPLSLRAGWSTFDAGNTFGDYDSLTVGVRWNFGGTLRDRDAATPFEAQTGLYQRVYGVQ